MVTEFTVPTGPGQSGYTSLSNFEAGTQCDLTSSQTKVYAGTETGTIADNASVSGDTSGATGTVVHCEPEQLMGKKPIHHFGKSISALLAGNPAWIAGHSALKLQDIGHTDRMGKVGKHRCVVGGISDVNDVFLDIFQRLMKNFFK